MVRPSPWRVAQHALEPTPAVAGAVVAGGLLALGLPFLAAPIAGLATLIGVAFAAASKKPGGVRTAVSAQASEMDVELNARWRSHVDEATHDQARYRDAIAEVSDVAIRASLDAMAPRFDEVVDAVRVIAARGQQLENALGKIATADELQSTISKLEQRSTPSDDKRLTSARYQLDTRNRVSGQIADIEHRLAQIDADRDVAVVRAVEAGLNSDEGPVVRAVIESIEHAGAELDALNRAMAEVDDIG